MNGEGELDRSAYRVEQSVHEAGKPTALARYAASQLPDLVQRNSRRNPVAL